MAPNVNAAGLTIRAPKRHHDEIDADAYDDMRVYPIFTAAEQDELMRLRRLAWKFRPYLGIKRLQTIHEEEEQIGADAMESGDNPFQLVADHWLAAIDLGKLYQERNMAINKGWALGLTLINTGLTTGKQVKHYIDIASDPDAQGVERATERLEEVCYEFNEALRENRVPCMCREEVCCCKV